MRQVWPRLGHLGGIEVGSDTPQMLALYLGMLDADFEIEHPQEMAEHFLTLAERYRRAVS